MIQSTAKVFEADIIATPVVGFAGSVQHVTERPGFGLQVAETQKSSADNPLPLESLFKANRNSASNAITVLEEEDDISPTGIASRIQQRIEQKKTKQQEFKARLKSRFERFKNRVQSEEQQQSTNVGRGSVSQINLQSPGRSSFGRSAFRNSRERSRSREVVDDDEVLAASGEETIQETIGTRDPRNNRLRDHRIRSRPATRVRPVAIEIKAESVEDLLGSPSFKNEEKITSSFGTRRRNRYRDRGSPVQAHRQNPSSSVHSFKLNRPSYGDSNGNESEPPTAPSVSVKRFNRFSRPEIRQSLLQKILGKGNGKNTIDPEEAERLKLEEEEEQEQERLEIIEAEVIIEGNDIDQQGLTTLQVSTVYPKNRKATSTFLEVATIRSPYSFAIDEGMSTRFITVTR